ncbi:hypothetical protein AGLY_012662 [Aphis glycines]|uniref:Uncharacterized protein n=1 Tax=Aphis glycines TaxID=307491 RepID=A0A6G0T950_APHGL|nr:hypothetical protein AGLY_012662 [Aphis glycines]
MCNVYTNLNHSNTIMNTAFNIGTSRHSVISQYLYYFILSIMHIVQVQSLNEDNTEHMRYLSVCCRDRNYREYNKGIEKSLIVFVIHSLCYSKTKIQNCLFCADCSAMFKICIAIIALVKFNHKKMTKTKLLKVSFQYWAPSGAINALILYNDRTPFFFKVLNTTIFFYVDVAHNFVLCIEPLNLESSLYNPARYIYPITVGTPLEFILIENVTMYKTSVLCQGRPEKFDIPNLSSCHKSCTYKTIYNHSTELQSDSLELYQQIHDLLLSFKL